MVGWLTTAERVTQRCSGADAQFRVRTVEVRADRAWRQVQFRADLLIRQSTGRQLGDLILFGREPSGFGGATGLVGQLLDLGFGAVHPWLGAQPIKRLTSEVELVARLYFGMLPPQVFAVRKA